MPLDRLSRLSVSAHRAAVATSEVSPVAPRGTERIPPPSSGRTSRPSPITELEPPPEAPFELIAANPTETVAIGGDCLLVIIGRTMSASGVHAVQRGCEQLSRRYPRFGYLSVIEGYRLGQLEPRARDLMAEVVSKYSPCMAVASFAVAGVGFGPTAVRSVLTAIHIASRSKHPMKVFSTLDGALEWYAATFPERRCDTPTLARIIDVLGPPGHKP